MNPDIKAQWLEALRSGDYTQGTGAMETGEGFCCLGVLCDLSPVGEWRKTEGYSTAQYGTAAEFDGFEANGHQLPPSIIEWSGLAYKLPDFRVSPDGTYFGLAELNDAGLTFSQIADVIEFFL